MPGNKACLFELYTSIPVFCIKYSLPVKVYFGLNIQFFKVPKINTHYFSTILLVSSSIFASHALNSLTFSFLRALYLLSNVSDKTIAIFCQIILLIRYDNFSFVIYSVLPGSFLKVFPYNQTELQTRRLRRLHCMSDILISI